MLRRPDTRVLASCLPSSSMLRQCNPSLQQHMAHPADQSTDRSWSGPASDPLFHNSTWLDRSHADKLQSSPPHKARRWLQHTDTARTEPLQARFLCQRSPALALQFQKCRLPSELPVKTCFDGTRTNISRKEPSRASSASFSKTAATVAVEGSWKVATVPASVAIFTSMVSIWENPFGAWRIPTRRFRAR